MKQKRKVLVLTILAAGALVGSSCATHKANPMRSAAVEEALTQAMKPTPAPSVPQVDRKKEVDLAALEGKVRPEVLEEMKTPLNFKPISSDELNRRIAAQEEAAKKAPLVAAKKAPETNLQPEVPPQNQASSLPPAPKVPVVPVVQPVRVVKPMPAVSQIPVPSIPKVSQPEPEETFDSDDDSEDSEEWEDFENFEEFEDSANTNSLEAQLQKAREIEESYTEETVYK